MAKVIKKNNAYYLDYHDGTRRVIRKHGPSKEAAQRALNALLIQIADRKFLGAAAPLGPVLAGATGEGICLLEFADRRMVDSHAADHASRGVWHETPSPRR